MSRAAEYATAIVVAIHLLINVVHGVAHREQHVGLAPSGSVFVITVVLILPLVAMALVWTAQKRLGLILLSLSMFGSLLFGLYHHFLVISPDHVHSQPASPWGAAFIFTAYGLLITEAIGTFVGIHFLSVARRASSKAVKT
jgi:hypothetical protein